MSVIKPAKKNWIRQFCDFGDEEETREMLRNEELEDKPVFEPTSKESEDSHGGDESTDSIEDSPNPGDESSEKDQEESDEGSSNPGDESSESEKDQEGNNDGSPNPGDEPSGEEGDSDESQESQEWNKTDSLFGSDCSRKSRMGRRFKERFMAFADSINAKTLSEEVGGDVLNPRELMRRKITKQSLSSCFVHENKPEVALVLDSSGSMSSLISELEELGNYFAVMYDDDIIDAPNFNVTNEDKKRIENADTVIFIGDYDGINTVFEMVKTSDKRIYWLCTEARYSNFIDHGWCDYDEKEISRLTKKETFKIANCNKIGEFDYNEKLWLRAIDKLMQ